MNLKRVVALVCVWVGMGSCAHQSESTLVPPKTKVSEEKLASPIPSTVPGISISNVHLVARAQGTLYRGMRPVDEQDARDLREKLGVTEVLIFREASKEVGVEPEMKMLRQAGISDEHLHYLPMKWRQIEDFKAACTMSIQALQLFKKTLSTKNSVLFAHCTVGEDRTGYIFGLYRILFEKRKVEEVFKNEMCEYGYAEGSPVKPHEVNAMIHQNITPLFLKMNYLIAKRRITEKNLDVSVCEKDPLEMDAQFKKDFSSQIEKYRCLSSSRVRNLSN